MTYPHNPPPVPYRVGCGPAECVGCGAATLAAPGVTRPRCEACLRTKAERSSGISANLPHVQDTISGLTWLPITTVHRDVTAWHARETDSAARVAKIRIIETSRTVELDDDRVPKSARLLVKRAEEAGRQVRLTYALAEDPDAAELVHSVCVRVWTAKNDAGRAERFGYASYVNGRSSSCVLWRGQEGGPRKCGVEEFAALVQGLPYTPPAPPPVGPCPTCGRLVRWTQAGQPHKHNKPETKDPCPGLQSS